MCCWKRHKEAHCSVPPSFSVQQHVPGGEGKTAARGVESHCQVWGDFSPTTSYTYYGSDQLTGERRGSGSGSSRYTESFTYDHNENRLTEDNNVGGTQVDSTYTYDNHDHLLTAGTKHYAYNADGDCTGVSNGSSVTTLKYDLLNHQIGITLPTGVTESYIYDGNWQRVAHGSTKEVIRFQ